MGGYRIGCSFSRDGHYLVSGSSSGSLVFYDYYTSHLLTSKKVFSKSPCLSVEYHPLLASTIAACSWNGEISILQSFVCVKKQNIAKESIIQLQSEMGRALFFHFIHSLLFLFHQIQIQMQIVTYIH